MGITYNKMLISILVKCNLTPIFFSVKINITYKVGGYFTAVSGEDYENGDTQKSVL